MSQTRSTTRAPWTLVYALTLGAAVAQTAGPAPGPVERERAACFTGANPQPQDVCLREAANAEAARRQGALGTPPAAELEDNAVRRCEALGGDNHAACLARMRGEGKVSGSVAGGGVLREVETPVSAEPAPSAPRP